MSSAVGRSGRRRGIQEFVPQSKIVQDFNDLRTQPTVNSLVQPSQPLKPVVLLDREVNVKTLSKFTLGTLTFCAAMIVSYPSAAQLVISGTIPPGSPVIVLPATANAGGTPYTVSGPLKFKFKAVTPGAYTLAFCVGQPSDPCGAATSIMFTVAGGMSSFALLNANVFANGNVLALSQPTSSTISFEISME
jgi:hypothetical protein